MSSSRKYPSLALPQNVRHNHLQRKHPSHALPQKIRHKLLHKTSLVIFSTKRVGMITSPYIKYPSWAPPPKVHHGQNAHHGHFHKISFSGTSTKCSYRALTENVRHRNEMSVTGTSTKKCLSQALPQNVHHGHHRMSVTGTFTNQMSVTGTSTKSTLKYRDMVTL